MNIISVNSPLNHAFTALGHTVLPLRSGGGVVDMAETAAAHGFKPDLVFQTESLGNRVFLKNLEDLRCPTIFWALDSHLNIHWHKYYTRLFDAVFTPHLDWYRTMPPAWTPARLERLAWPGTEIPFRPHADRSRPLAFVGRNDPASRPLRARFLALLRPLGLTSEDDLDYAGMMRVYGDARIVPNESIAWEVNFRLMEGASAGACVLGPDVGGDQNALYAPDREILVYEHGLDLVEKAAFLKAHPHLAEKMGRAAWERTRAEHLPAHRARTVLEQAASLVPGTPDPVFLAMAAVQRGRHAHAAPPPALLNALAASSRPEALALRLRCLSEFGPADEREQAVRACLRLPEGEAFDDARLAGLGHALLHKKLNLFRVLWRSLTGNPLPEPASIYEAALLLAEALRGRGLLFQPGFAYDARAMTPESALEALLMARSLADDAGGDREWARRLLRLTARSRAWSLLRLEALDHVPDDGPDDGGDAARWPLLLTRGRICLDACDMEQGMASLRRALAGADAAGRRARAARLFRHWGVSVGALKA